MAESSRWTGPKGFEAPLGVLHLNSDGKAWNWAARVVAELDELPLVMVTSAPA